jgi:adenylate cyclase
MEIERKFLVRTLPDGLDERPHDRIEQGYVAIDDRAEVRIRRRGDERTLTIKSAPGRTRIEVELEIDAERFDALWLLTEGRRVVKTRYLLDGGAGATIELDVYEGALAGLLTAEVEFDSEADSDAFAPPGWLDRELTGDARYANQTLATAGRPAQD